MTEIIASVKYNDRSIDLYSTDLWFIETIRKLQFGELSKVKIQNGRISIIEQAEKKIKPPEVRLKQ